MQTGPLLFTTRSFPRTRERQEKAKVPLGVSFEPVPRDHQVYDCELVPCSKCGAFPVPPRASLPVEVCVFCGNQLKLPDVAVLEDSEWLITPDRCPRTAIVIDAGASARSNGLVSAVLDAARTHLSYVKNVAVICVANDACFLMKGGRVGVIPDLAGADLPSCAFMDELPQKFDALEGMRQQDRGPDVVSVMDMLVRVIGADGRVVLFLGSLPSGEVSFARVTPDNESATLRGPNFTGKFEEIVKVMERMRMRFDVFVYNLSARLIDSATFGRAAAATGGRLYYANPTQKYALREKIGEFLQGIDTECSIRISQGTILPSLGARQHFPGRFMLTTPNCVMFPIQLPELLDGEVTVQATVMFRAFDGTVRRRVYTRVVPVTDDISLVYKEADCAVVLKEMTASMISMFFLRNVQMPQMKDCVLAMLKTLFECYRFHVSRSPNRFMKMVMPGSLQMLPKFALGILKSTAFTPGISMDERGAQIFALNEMTPEQLLSVSIPVFYDVTAFVDTGAEIRPLELTEANLVTDRLYVLLDGFGTFVWIGRNLDKDLCKRTFGKGSAYIIEKVQPIDTDESRRLYSLFRGNVRQFIETKGTSVLFTDRLIEDSASLYPSYGHWLDMVNKASTPSNK